MKNILIVSVAIGLAFLLFNRSAYSGNAELISEIPLDLFSVYKIHDGNTKCYVITGNSPSTMAISCVRVK